MATELQTNWKHYIEELFFAAWENNSPVDLTDYAFLIQHHFDMQKIDSQLTQAVSEAAEPEKTIRFHKNRIRTLIQIFIEALLNVSDDGKHITSKNIEKAKLMMEGEERCIYNC